MRQPLRGLMTATLLLGLLSFAPLPAFETPPALETAHAARPALAAAGMSQARVVLAGRQFVVDVAQTEAQQRRGLGGRQGLKPDEGMLFLYAGKATRTFWMKGMVIAIDILWLDNNRIVHIEHRVPPPRPGASLSALPTYAAPVAANGVLEIAAGRAEQLGLRVGNFATITFN